MVSIVGRASLIIFILGAISQGGVGISNMIVQMEKGGVLLTWDFTTLRSYEPTLMLKLLFIDSTAL